MNNNQYKTKVNISITIDTELYIYYKTKEEFNLSGTINEYLKTLKGSEQETVQDIKNKIEKKQSELRYAEYELNKKKREEIEQAALEKQKQRQKEQEEINKIPIGESFQNKLEREKMFKEKPELKQKWDKQKED